MFWIRLGVGLVAGGIFGMITMAFCVAASRGE